MLSKSKNRADRFIAFSSLANLGRNKKTSEKYFIQFLPIIESNLQEEANNVKDAMHLSLLYWGQRSKDLNSKVIKTLQQIGQVIVDYGETSCQTPDVLKALLSDRIQNKLI